MNYLLTAFLRAILLPVFLVLFLFSEKGFSQTCNNWLETPSGNSFVTVGDLDITGNKLTVEAVFNRASAFDPTLSFGKIVSKHTDASNVNYAIMPGQCEITTDVTGYVATPLVCTPKLDKTYHVAMVYDGATLKFYRDGYLLTQTPCTGNLITNNLLTTIGQLADPAHPANMQHLGFINEIRIWRVARTQAEIRTYMNSSLPATPQTGLAGYYVFNSLQNKQGNTAFNGILNGASQINQVNPVCEFVPDSCNVLSPGCNNWLNVPTQPSWVNIGDVDVPGDKLTVEALINIKGNAPGGSILGLDVVSKHTTFTNVNYLLRASHAELSTTNGYFYTPYGCPMEMNKTYHVAMVYDGATLKYYRNGFLVGQAAATGNMIQSDLPTGIGFISTLIQPENFIGFINEVRIWKVARTQTQIKTFMGSSLPNPTTQTGLVSYHTFDNLLNKQGNPAWNGTLVGAASINQINPECNFVADTCVVPIASPCDKALHLPVQGSKVTIGDVDVTGNKLTVEAMFNRNMPLNNGIYYGHLVSKHSDQSNVNYALLPNGCEITTSGSGYKAIFQDCPLVIGKTYHVAMVYDGATLKFYRNGILLSQTACTGNVVNNNLLTTIGQVARGDDPFDNQFLGYANEVRIWKEARTQTQIQTYMNQALPNPTAQTGLVAYHSFNNLDNKQGNIAFNGTIRGSAAIGKKNPDCTFVPSACNTLADVTPAFIIPDTVCVNTPVNISNISNNATSNFWSFCAADGNKIPQATNIGNPGNTLNKPVFMDYVLSNGNYYGFVVNHAPAGLTRLDFGNSLLNTPVATSFGNLGGVLPLYAEGIQVIQNEGRWYAIIVGGSTQNGVTPYVVKVDFGPVITNNTPTATNWGNLGNIDQPIDLHMFKENGNWYGFTVSAENNTITRINFTNTFNNIPTAVNFGNIGSLNYPTGINAIKHNGNWHVFVTNALGNASLVRLDFGNSLLNTPVAVNLGNPGNVLELTRDMYIMKGCDQFIGYAVLFNDRVVKIDFKNDILSIPTLTSLGNIGNLDFPHSISKLFRVGNDLYSFITNVDNNTITRFRFAGCENGNIPNSSLQNPPPVTYTIPGTYNISLTVDDGLPTQASVCKQVVVLPALEHKATQSISICNGSTVKIGSASKTGTYLWNNGTTTDSIVVNTGGIYWVETSRFGCMNRDSFDIKIASPVLNIGNDTTVCVLNNFILDAGNPGATYAWNNGSTSRTIQVSAPGTYYVDVIVNSCKVTDTIHITLFNAASFDFSYKQDVCNPFILDFTGSGTTLNNSSWDFGDGTIVTGNANVRHTFAATGTYVIKYSISVGSCKDTIQKLILVDVTKDNVVLTSDTTICFGTATPLRTAPALNFCWSPVNFLDNPNSPNPVTSTTQDITYYYTAEVPGANLITNGDFSQGNTGFTSDYIYAATYTAEGQYFIGSNPRAWLAGYDNCGDHTSLTGNMMIVNAVQAVGAQDTVWQKTIPVLPNTNYAFSTWILSVVPNNAGQIQLSINGRNIGGLINFVTSSSCNWARSYVTWNSGNNTTAIISIVSKITLAPGNDFALDDISFAPVFIKRDSVKISIEKPFVKSNNDTTICPGSPVQLNTNGAQNYVWSPAAGLSNTAIPNPVASPIVSTEYIVAGTTINGCVAKDTVKINVYIKPAMTISNDTIICSNTSAQLLVTGGAVYEWSPAATLSNPNIYNPVAAPATATRYYVTITDNNSCKHKDSTDVAIRPPAVFSISNPQQVCMKDSIQLTASGGDVYVWQPAQGLNNNVIANPLASPAATTDYTVTITESICNESETLSTRLTVLPSPVITASRSNDIDCSNDRSQLNASGADQYIWTPATTLSNQNIRNPVATPVATTEYIVKGTSLAGCKGFDTVVVKVDNVNKGGYEMPNAFTPNNDGKNDCYGIRYWGIINDLEFSVYNRWGERIFFTKNAAQCWDGTYKGVEQEGGVYVYMIKAKTSCESEVFRKGTFVLVR